MSVFSLDDKTLPLDDPASSTLSPAGYSDSRSSVDYKDPAQRSITEDQMSTSVRSTSGGDDVPIYRSAEAFVRPGPVYTNGDVISYGFDLRSCTFSLSLNAQKSTDQNFPTEIYLPTFHFPQQQYSIEVSGGKWTITSDIVEGVSTQVLRWWHAEGEQKLTAKGIKRKNGLAVSPEDAEESYLEQYRRTMCTVM